MIWIPQEVVADMETLRKQVEAEVEAKYKHKIEMLHRSIDVLERENVRLNRAIVDIKRSKRPTGTQKANAPSVQLDELIAHKEREFQRLGMV